eukprot:COSAG01_NODE_9901_length_2306_cov_1328.861350_1_plen_124_part_00
MAEKEPYITGRDPEEVRADPELSVVKMVQFRRLKWLGNILRMPEWRIMHQEVCAYAELVRRGVIEKKGSLIEHAPQFESMHLRQRREASRAGHAGTQWWATAGAEVRLAPPPPHAHPHAHAYA